MADSSKPASSRQRRVSRGSAGLLASLLLASCASDRSDREIAELLVILPGAAEVQVQPRQVVYRVAEAYPGRASLQALDDRLSRQGCRAADEDPLNAAPGVMRRTWAELGQKGGGMRMVWMGAWSCDRGDVVTYTISVAEPGMHAGLPLGVAGGYYSASQVRMIRSKTRATP